MKTVQFNANQILNRNHQPITHNGVIIMGALYILSEALQGNLTMILALSFILSPAMVALIALFKSR